jgi:hypothetical protein
MMDREEILRLANKHGLQHGDRVAIGTVDELIAFANAIAAHERDEIANLVYVYKMKLDQNHLTEYIKCSAASDIEDAIRSRGNK